MSKTKIEYIKMFSLLLFGLLNLTNVINDIRIITIMTDAKTTFNIKSEQVTFDITVRGFKGEYLPA